MKTNLSLISSLILLLTACGTNPAPTPTLFPTDPPASPTPTSIPDTPSLTDQGPTYTPAPPTPTTSPPLAPPVFAIVDGFAGFVMGGAQAGDWVGPEAIAQYVTGGENYHLYYSIGHLGDSLGSAPTQIENGPCAGTLTIAFDMQVPLGVSEYLAFGGDWNPKPRPMQYYLDTNLETYTDVVKQLLLAQGLAHRRPNCE